MSVIPFVLDGSNKTVVQTPEEYQKAGGLEGQVILIRNLDVKQIRDTESSNASYNFTVGNEYRDHRDSGKTDLLENGKISLQPGSAVIIETAETVEFPKSRFGHVVPKVSLLQSGLSNTSSKIDPGYNGKLSITVFNLGKRAVELQKGQEFCTLYVLDVKEGVIPYRKDAKKIAGNSRKDLLSTLKDFIETNQAYFTIILTIATIVLTVVQIVQSPGQKQEVQISPKAIKR
ncbi:MULTISPECIES: dCTP deaminase domain-containing protein [unclassified Anabaena]|uniref:dCTP deaminase domain-containing protein n=1 Tax=unclassified Anabaena TaxID=2619674 RepID=UPI0039C6CCB1